MTTIYLSGGAKRVHQTYGKHVFKSKKELEQFLILHYHVKFTKNKDTKYIVYPKGEEGASDSAKNTVPNAIEILLEDLIPILKPRKPSKNDELNNMLSELSIQDNNSRKNTKKKKSETTIKIIKKIPHQV